MKLLIWKIFKIEINKPVILIGAGGHAKVLIEALQLSGCKIIGLTDPDKSLPAEINGIAVLGDDSIIFKHSIQEILLVNGIGSMPGDDKRFTVNQRMIEKGYQFAKVIHPSAVISNNVEIADGVQIMAGVIIQPGVKIGKACIINTRTSVDHDCILNDNCHLAPGVTLSGNVIVGKNTHIGTGTSIIQNISIGDDCVVAAGSVVFRDISDNSKFVQLRN